MIFLLLACTPQIPTSCTDTPFMEFQWAPETCQRELQQLVGIKSEVLPQVATSPWALATAELPQPRPGPYHHPELVAYLDSLDPDINQALFELVVENVKRVGKSNRGHPWEAREVVFWHNPMNRKAIPWTLAHEAFHAAGAPNHSVKCGPSLCDPDQTGAYGMSILVADLFSHKERSSFASMADAHRGQALKFIHPPPTPTP